MKNTMKYLLVASILAAAPAAFAEKAPDCKALYAAVTQEVTSSSDKVLEIVEKYVAENEACACEIVKAAIVASEADKKLVAEIVTTATLAAPDKLRLVAQCAIAVAPDALANVQAVLSKYDRHAGEGPVVEAVVEVSDAKGGMEVGPNPGPPLAVPNPLDGPGNPGGMGSFPLIPVIDPPIHPEFPDLFPVSAPNPIQSIKEATEQRLLEIEKTIKSD